MGNAKQCTNYHTIALISHAKNDNVQNPLKLQQYMNQEIPDVQLGFEEAKESEIKLPTFIGSWIK